MFISWFWVQILFDDEAVNNLVRVELGEPWVSMLPRILTAYFSTRHCFPDILWSKGPDMENLLARPPPKMLSSHYKESLPGTESKELFSSNVYWICWHGWRNSQPVNTGKNPHGLEGGSLLEICHVHCQWCPNVSRLGPCLFLYCLSLIT